MKSDTRVVPNWDRLQVGNRPGLGLKPLALMTKRPGQPVAGWEAA